MSKVIFSTLLLVLLVACNNNKTDKSSPEKNTVENVENNATKNDTIESNIVKLTIASQYGDCMGMGPRKCLFVKNDAGEWEFFYSNIEGFDYKPGYEYVIEVKKEELENVPADASSIKYILVKEISKTEKQSENLPSIK